VAAICGLDLRVDTVFARALSKNPRSRFDSCEQFGQVLAEALNLPGRRSVPTMPEIRIPTVAPAPSNSAPNSTRLIAAAMLGVLATLLVTHLIHNLQAEPVLVRVDAGDFGPGAAKPVNAATSKFGPRRHSNARASTAADNSDPADSSIGISPSNSLNDAGTAQPNLK
jgi:hypothetical protein